MSFCRTLPAGLGIDFRRSGSHCLETNNKTYNHRPRVGSACHLGPLAIKNANNNRISAKTSLNFRKTTLFLSVVHLPAHPQVSDLMMQGLGLGTQFRGMRRVRSSGPIFIDRYLGRFSETCSGRQTYSDITIKDQKQIETCNQK